jgi:hypothetical protein
MTRSTLVRRGGGLAVATVLAAAGGLATAGSALASDRLDVQINPYNLTLPALANGASVTKSLHIYIYHDQQGTVGTAKVVINASGLSRIAQVIWPSSCTHVGDVGTCARAAINGIESGNNTFLNLGLKARPGVRSGQGTVEVTASNPELGRLTTSAPVSVAEGTDLVASPLPQLNDVKIGSTVQAAVSWSNTGDETAPRTQVTMWTPVPGLAFKQHFKNCTYSANGRTAVCTFNTALKPGQTLRFPAPVELTVTKEAWYTGMAVTVEALGSGKARPPADLNTNDNYAELDLHAVNTAHFAAIGASVHGQAGQTIPVTVGMHSTGPAFIYDRSGGEAVGDIDVEFPAGTTVVGVPQNCFLVQGTQYTCWIPADVAPGQQFLYTFSLRVNTVVAGAKGKVWLSNSIIQPADPAIYSWDPSQAGHTAALVLNP